MPHSRGTPDRTVHDTNGSGGGSVSVTNFPADYPDVTLQGKVPDEEGVWDYVAGTSGTEVIPAGGRVLGIAAATAQAGGTVTINGGDAIPIPVPTSGVGAVDIAPRGNVVAPTVVFANTDSYLIEFVI